MTNIIIVVLNWLSFQYHFSRCIYNKKVEI